MQMDELTFLILKMVVSICVALITAYVIPYLKALKSDRDYDSICDIVTVGVKAAEQTITESGQGKFKKQQVISFVTNWLNEHNIVMSDDQLSQLIECIVFEMNEDKKNERAN